MDILNAAKMLLIVATFIPLMLVTVLAIPLLLVGLLGKFIFETTTKIATVLSEEMKLIVERQEE